MKLKPENLDAVRMEEANGSGSEHPPMGLRECDL